MNTDPTECESCHADLDTEEIENPHEDEDGDVICDNCYRDSLVDCQICEDGHEANDMSQFILVKAELAETGNRIPGVYTRTDRTTMMHCMLGSTELLGGNILFIEQLPWRDDVIEISGEICKQCAEKRCYNVLKNAAYGLETNGQKLAELEKKRVLEVVTQSPEILQDLDTDTLDEKILRWCDLPSDKPTYWPLIFLDYKGVKIYSTIKNNSTWLTIRPEPSFRGKYTPGLVFTATGLSTWEPIKLDPNRTKDPGGNYYDTGYRYGHESDQMEACREACRKAIDLGLITQKEAPKNAR